MSFDELGLQAELVAALAAQGITDPFPIQALTISDTLAGRDVCGKAQTGSGKTLAFGLPLLQAIAAAGPGRLRGLVLVPTRELARQVVEVLSPLGRDLGLRTLAFYGGTPFDRQVRAFKRPVDIVVATPGRLIDLVDRASLDLREVETLVIDEADRMADMGFMPQVEWILRQLDGRRQTLLFSATLDGAIDNLVRRYLNDPVRHEVVTTIETVEEMEHRFLHVHEMDRVKVAAAIVRGATRTLVFVRTKRGAERLVSQLRKEGVRAEGIHGNMPQAARERSLRDFAEGKCPVLVATDVAGRGIHVEDVDVVLHFDVPDDHKAYVHRSGRTARAGKKGTVATLVLWNQVYEADRLQRRLGLDEPLVEVFSNDKRLTDLVSFGS